MDGGMESMSHQCRDKEDTEKRKKMNYMVSECCGSPPLTNTDVHDGIAMCDQCKEWSGFYDEEEDEDDGSNSNN